METTELERNKNMSFYRSVIFGVGFALGAGLVQVIMTVLMGSASLLLMR